MKNVFKVVFVIVGTVIGAGFASGKEIFTFFNIYGYKGFIGIIASMLLIGVVINKTLRLVKEKNITGYSDFISQTISGKPTINNTLNCIINIFLIISFQIMVAGFGAYFFQELQINQMYGAIIIAVLSYITFLGSIDGVVKINEYLIPIIAALIVILGLKNSSAFFNVEFKGLTNVNGWITSSILYISYNSITLIPILISLKKYIATQKEITEISILVTSVMLLLGTIIYIVLNSEFDIVKNFEMPIVYMANNQYKYLYGFVVLVAIFTTAISAGYSFLSNCTKTRKQYIILALIMCISSIFVSRLGFSNLLNIMYPVFGYLGIIQMFFILIA